MISFLLAGCIETDTNVDLVFVVDGSGSICDNDPTKTDSGCRNWQQVKRFITEFVSVMEPSVDGTHVGLVSFGSSANLLLTLDR